MLKIKPDREAANAERANRAAPDFLGEQGRKDWQCLPEATRVYVWRRLDELHAAPAKQEARLATSLGFTSIEVLRAFRSKLEPFVQHAVSHKMMLSQYLALFADNEAKARGGDITSAVQSLLVFIGLDPGKIGRGMLALSAALHLPQFNAALENIFAAFGARSIEQASARQAVAELAVAASAHGLLLSRDASRFVLAEAA